MHNPASVCIWNSEKRYLGRLADKGVPVVPTLYARALTPEAMAEASARFMTDRLVAKPQISSGAWQTIRWSPGDPLEGGPEGPAMVQPYLPEIETSGEVSLLYFGGRFSHAIAKRPQPGDFRVQPEHDGIISAYEPQEDELDAARAILDAVEEDLLYARVDLVRGSDGRPMLIELELIEPDLYLGYDPAGGAGFAGAIKELIDR
jgi:glutathione synthase/RimK-type ligase-like ATP-grasp enzyme